MSEIKSPLPDAIYTSPVKLSSDMVTAPPAIPDKDRGAPMPVDPNARISIPRGYDVARDKPDWFDTPEIKDLIFKSQNLDLAMSISENRLEWSLKAAKLFNFNKMYELEDLAIRFDRPEEHIRQNYEEYHDRAINEDFHAAVTTKDRYGRFHHPQTLSWLQDPKRAAFVGDGVNDLLGFERSLKDLRALDVAQRSSFTGRMMHTVSDLPLEIIQGVAGAYEWFFTGLLMLDKYVAQPIWGTEESRKNDITRTYIEGLQKYYGDVHKDPTFYSAPLNIGGVEGFAHDFTRLVPQLGIQMGIALTAGPVPASLAMLGYMSGQAYQELTDRGVSSDIAWRISSVVGFINAALEAGPQAYFLKHLKLKGLPKTEFAKHMAIMAGGEFGEEFLQTHPEAWGEIMGDIALEDVPEGERWKNWMDKSFDRFLSKYFLPMDAGGILPRAGYSGLLGFAGGGLMGGVGAKGRFNVAHRVVAGTEFLKMANEHGGDLEAAKKANPGKYAALVEHMAHGSNITDVFILAQDIIDVYAAEDGLGAEEMRKMIASLGPDMEKAFNYAVNQEGGTFVVPIGTWTAIMSNTLEWAKLLSMGNVRYQADGPTIREAQEQLKKFAERHKKTAEYVEELRKQRGTLEELPEPLKAWREELMEKGGMSADEATETMLFAHAGMKIAAKGLNMTVEQYMDFRGLHLLWDEEAKAYYIAAEKDSKGKTLKQRQLDSIGFFSRVQEAVSDMDFKRMPADQLLARLKKTDGVRGEELADMGLAAWLERKGKGKVTKAEVEEFVRANRVQLIRKTLTEEGEEGDSEIDAEGAWEAGYQDMMDNYDLEDADMRDEKTEKADEEWVELSGEHKQIWNDQTEDGDGREVHHQSFQDMNNIEFAEKYLTSEETQKFYDYEWEADSQWYIDKAIETGEYTSKENIDGTSIRHGEHTIEGGVALREFLLKLPDTGQDEAFIEDAHYEDVENILTFFRTSYRTTTDGQSVFFLEEIQSDWHQRGREGHYENEEHKEKVEKENALTQELKDIQGELNPKRSELERLAPGKTSEVRMEETPALGLHASLYSRVRDANGHAIEEESGDTRIPISNEGKIKPEHAELIGAKRTALVEEFARKYEERRKLKTELWKTVPDAPMKETKTWGLVAFKGALLQAIEDGDKILAWTPGEVHAWRWGHIQMADEVQWKDRGPTPDGERQGMLSSVRGQGLDKRTGNSWYVKAKDLHKYVGKEAAKTLLEGKVEYGYSSFRFDKTTIVGKKGLIEFYNKVLPSTVKKFVRQLDSKAKVEVFEVNTKGYKTDTLEVLGVKITQKMKDKAKGEGGQKAGFSMYRQADGIDSDEKANQEKRSRQGETKLPRGFIDPSNRTKIPVGILKTADRSTFLHEMGHLFVLELIWRVEADRENASPQDIADYELLKKLAGGEFTEDGMEQINKYLDAYIMTGKAPSAGLLAAFRRFKEWLIDIYETIKHFGVELNPEITAVFDRLIAAKEDIDWLHHEISQVKPFQDAMKYTKAEQKVSDELLKARAHTAWEKHAAALVRAYMEADGLYDDIAKYAKKLVERNPAYKVIDDIVKKGGLNRADVKAEGFLIDEIKQINKSHGGRQSVIRNKGKLTLDDVIEFTGLANSKAVISMILNAENKSEAIGDLTGEMTRTTEAKLYKMLNQGENEVGERADHNSANVIRIVGEAQIAQDRAQATEKRAKKRVVASEILYRARKRVSRLKSKKARDWKTAHNREKKMAEKAVEAAKRGNMKQVEKYKIAEAEAHAEVTARLEYDTEIQSLLKRAKNLAKRKNIQVDYHEQILDIIAKAEFFPGRRAMTPEEQAATGKQSTRTGTQRKYQPKSPEQLQSLRELVSVGEQTTTEFNPQIADFIYDGEISNYKEMTVEEVRHIGTALKWIAHLGSRNTIAKEAAKAEERVAKLQAMLAAGKDVSKRSGKTIKRGKKSKLIDASIAVSAPLSKVQFRLRDLDGSQNFGPRSVEKGMGPNERTLFPSQAENEYLKLWGKYETRLLANFGTLAAEAKEIIKNLGKGNARFNIPGANFTHDYKVNLLSKDNKWEVDELFMAILNTGNQGNLDALQLGYEFSNEAIDILRSQLSAEALGAVQDIWDVMEELYLPMNDVFKRMHNMTTKQVKAKGFTVTSRDGQEVKMRGGYFPLVGDHQLMTSNEAGWENAELQDRKMAAYHDTPEKILSSQKMRHGSNKPPLLKMSLIGSHVSDTIRYITHAEAMHEIKWYMVHNQQWGRMYEEAFGRREYKQLEEWINYVMWPSGSSPKTKTMKSFAEIRRLSTLALLGWRLGVGFKQFGSMFGAATEVGAPTVIKGIAIAAANPVKTFKAVNALSVFMSNRNKRIDRVVLDANRKLKFSKRSIIVKGKQFTWRDVQDFGFAIIRLADTMAVYPIWIGSYEKAISSGMSVPDATLFADNIIRTTQPSSAEMDLTQWQRSDGIMRLFSMFQTFRLVYHNRTRSYLRGFADGNISGWQLTRHVIYEQLLPVFAMVMTMSLLKGDEPPEDVRGWGIEGMDYWVSYLPFVNQMTSGYKYHRRGLSVPSFAPIDEAVSFGQTGVKAIVTLDSPEEWQKFFKSAIPMIEMLTGLPTSRVLREWKKIVRAEE